MPWHEIGDLEFYDKTNIVDLKYGGPRNVLSYDIFCWFVSLVLVHPLHKSNMAASWHDRSFGSTCHKIMYNTSIMGFVGLQNPFTVLDCHFIVPIKTFYDCVKRYKDCCSWRKKFFHKLFINAEIYSHTLSFIRSYLVSWIHPYAQFT